MDHTKNEPYLTKEHPDTTIVQTIENEIRFSHYRHYFILAIWNNSTLLLLHKIFAPSKVVANSFAAHASVSYWIDYSSHLYRYCGN